MAKNLLDAVYGCTIAGAIGDALGAPVEGWYHTEIKEKYGKVTELMNYEKNYCGGAPGRITDDTALRHYLCKAIIDRGGRVTPDDYAKQFRRINPDIMWTSEKMVRIKLSTGVSPWDSGRGVPPAGTASMAIAPIGIINAGNPRQAYQDGFNIAFVNQDDFNRDAAATLAAGVAKAFVPGVTVQEVLDSMLEHSSSIVERSMILGLDLAEKSNNIDEFTVKFYDKMLDWTWPRPRGKWNKDYFNSGSSIEILPVVAGIFYLCKGDVNECIIEGASFGRDCDTISSIVGSIAGAMTGAGPIRKDWIETVEKANEHLYEIVEGDKSLNFYSVAERLAEVIEKEWQATKDRAAFLENLIQNRKA